MLPMVVAEIREPDDRQFMTELYEEYSRLMYRTAWDMIKEPAGVEDVVQDALVSLIQKADLLRTLERPKLVSYVVHTVRNTAIDHLNKKRRTEQRVIDLDVAALTGEEEQDRPLEDRLLDRELVDAFRQVWDTLPEREKTLLRGKYVFRESDAELADRIGCKPGSVRMALTRAKRLVARELERRQGDDTPGILRTTV